MRHFDLQGEAIEYWCRVRIWSGTCLPPFPPDLHLRVARSVADDLTGRGHRVTWADEPLGGFQAVQVDAIRGVMYGASDHRKDGIALAA
jgi:gamma-glutamyltranspeptidase